MSTLHQTYIYVLNKSIQAYNQYTLDSLLHFFYQDHFCTYNKERNPSISANINTLIALKSYSNRTNQIPGFDEYVSRLVTKYNSLKINCVEDKWHLSPFYATSRAVFALHSLDNDLAEICVNRMIETQNSDFGFGINGSTLEETALGVVSDLFLV